ncbi:thioredoxin [Granulosicoccus sp.]|nr:thioredoxin [Granulosicoccus sp.]MDB4222242.1 thioredoxin [Granulosicoccus sp.]
MADSPFIVQLSEENFMEVVVEGSDNTPVLVDFWADWCGPCKNLMPILEKLAIEYNGAFILAKLDTEANPGIAQQLGIRSLPTVKLFKDRQLVNEFMGALPESEVRTFLDTHVGPALEVEAPEEEEVEVSVLDTAMALFAQGQADEARSMLQTAQADEPENMEILLALGQICVSTGDVETAESCLKAISDTERDSVAGRRLAGTLELARESDSEASTQELQAQLDSNPDSSEIRYKLAIAEALAGNMQTGMDHLLKLVQIDAGYNDGAPKEKLLALFNVLGDDPLVGQYRRKLFATLH